MKHTDVLVIGAGPSGTVAAAIIKKAGYDVTIVEKLQFPRFVIGESLLPRCLDALEHAGLLPALSKCSFRIKQEPNLYVKVRSAISHSKISLPQMVVLMHGKCLVPILINA